MNLVDSCGWLEYLAGGPNAEHFAPAIEDSARLLVPVICLYEVFKNVLRQFGEQKAVEVAAAMRRGRVVAIDDSAALAAAAISLEVKLAMADSLILATAQLNKAIVWTQDTDFEGMEFVRYFRRQ